ncbi:SRPBCC domain-containing protein [Promicromonospora aerolata]|uniref:SRPBCC domain-containing protein n=1 Tax=Promicromonospora aerolata TaxID=195749 RepID=A0ABW4V2X9_9MICO
MTLPSDTEILVAREFNAPRHLVWKVLTEPELIKRWWAGQRGTVTDVTVDLRVPA